MLNGRPDRTGFRLGLPIQTGAEDRPDALIGAGIESAGAGRGGFQPIRPIALTQTKDAQTAAEALFGMAARLKHARHQLGGERTGARCPADEPFRCPFQVALMRGGPMRIDGGVRPAFELRG